MSRHKYSAGRERAEHDAPFTAEVSESAGSGVTGPVTEAGVQAAPADDASAQQAEGRRESYFRGDKLLGSSRRIWELDFIRGVCVLLMVFDHIIYDLAYIFGPAWSQEAGGSNQALKYLVSAARAFNNSAFHTQAQHIVVWIFCLICGISCYFSRSNLKRGIMVAIFAFLITVVTKAIDDFLYVRFGILHMFAVAILLWWVIDTLCRHKKLRTATVCLVLGIAIIVLNEVFMAMYEENEEVFSKTSDWYFLGEWMTHSDFASADYYPVFPSVGYMLIGSFVGYVLYSKRRSLLPRLGRYDWHAPFDMWGRMALWVYVFHQVVVASILALISYIFLTPGDFVII